MVFKKERRAAKMVFTPRVLMITSMVVGAVAVATLALSVSTDSWLYTTEVTEKGLQRNATEKVVHAHMGLWKVCTEKGAVAVATLALSVSTDSWLFTTEVTEKGLQRNDTETVVHAHMGLWKVCTEKDKNAVDDRQSQPASGQSSGVQMVTVCYSYDSLDPDTQNQVDVTSMAIMRGTRFAALFPVVALIMITVAVILGILGNIRRDIKTLVAAVIFILSGLTLAVGIIFYISAINDEVGHRSKGKDGKKFAYDYGWSFAFAGMAFMITEATAVVFVTLYMQRNSNKDDMVRIIPGLEEKFGSDGELDDTAGGATNPTIIL